MIFNIAPITEEVDQVEKKALAEQGFVCLEIPITPPLQEIRFASAIPNVFLWIANPRGVKISDDVHKVTEICWPI